jgi:ribonuclease VapC
MIVAVDSSAIIAMLFDEPPAEACVAALESASSRMISAVNYVETGTVLAGRIRNAGRMKAIRVLDRFLATLGIDVAPLDEPLARAALRARLEFGKGFGVRGGLNFGDCFAYALAMRHAAPLLYVGDDFAVTGVRSALAS